MTNNDIFTYIDKNKIPLFYIEYYQNIIKKTFKIFEKSATAKSTLVDSSGTIEPKIVFDLADRVAKMHNLDISNKLRILLKTKSKELTALLLSEEIARGKYIQSNTTLEQKLELAVRVGLAIVTEGVTIAPLQGIHAVKIKKNKDNTDYLSVSIAGPIRSAGGTESAVTILIADHIRKVVGLSKYQANSFDDETGRFVEELRIYEREAQANFQFHVTDDDVIKVISNLPVEIDGVDTEQFEVINHKNMIRIKTNRVRGGTLRVLNDGLIGRSKKLLKRIELYKLTGWEWLNELKGTLQTSSNDDSSVKRMKEVIAGRSVLSMPDRIGGFRLRYGRACNTGFTAVGIHPVVSEILDNTIVAGTQIKMNIPGKGATIAFVDSLDTPIVKLKNGDVLKIKDTLHGIQIKKQIDKILYLGDILISFGDFLENNADLIPSGYVEEFWCAELSNKIQNNDKNIRFLNNIPTLNEALEISSKLKMPLYPKYLYYWEQISFVELKNLLQPLIIKNNLIIYHKIHKPIFEKLGIPHSCVNDTICITDIDAQILRRLILNKKINLNNIKKQSVLKTIFDLSGIEIRAKFSTSVGVRIGRPEKASIRKMKPPVHTLFPINSNDKSNRDLHKTINQDNFSILINNRICMSCNKLSLGIKCIYCNKKTTVIYICNICNSPSTSSFCIACKKQTALLYGTHTFPLKQNMIFIQEKTGIRINTPFKGVKELVGQNKIAEPLEKGLIRQSLDLTVFKDGTIRFDVTNSPLTHFQPKWINTSIKQLNTLGYEFDSENKLLTDLNQTVELRMQDIIIPLECCAYLIKICKFIDIELEKFYGKKPFYNVKNADDLIGHLVIGLAPHTSVGIVGRIIGYTKTHACFATPNWHSAKRRDADGDADSIILLTDALLNFSRNFLSDRIGGLMDAPLLIQPLVLPQESQSQAHNLEIIKKFPFSFFDSTMKRHKAVDVSSVDIIKSKLDTKKQFYGYHYTHETSMLSLSNNRNAYSTLNSMFDKLDLQLRNAELINAVDVNEIIMNLLSTHILPDIMGNLRAYTMQKFRCTLCGAKYRRSPLFKKCRCGNNLIQTLTRASVEKYLKLAIMIKKKYQISKYMQDRIDILTNEIDLVFGKNSTQQLLLTDYL